MHGNSFSGTRRDKASDEVLTDRIRLILFRQAGYSEFKMFGSACFMINGDIRAGTCNGPLIVRLDKKDHDKTLADPHTAPAGIESNDKLAAWLTRAVDFAGSLPAKK